jgi:hypothetical protein
MTADISIQLFKQRGTGKMSGYTKTGLLMLMILIILSLITVLLTFGFYSSFRPADTQKSFLPGMVPISMLGLAGGLLTLIGGVLILVGRKEFGEHHSRFIIYALIVFFVSEFISIFISVIYIEYPLVWFLVSSFITTILFGLIWMLVLYHLENKKGRTVLLAAFIFIILTATVMVVSTFLNLNAWNSQGSFNLSQSFLSSQSRYVLPWVGLSGSLLLFCYIGEYTLLFVSLFIPYQRISSGSLQSVQSAVQAQIMCPTCGRTIPYDSISCPYCGTHL